MLSPYRVLDLTDSRAALGPLILAGLGADVIKVEPPGGDPSREWPPFRDRGGVRQSLHFMATNANSSAINIDAPH